MFDLDWNSSGFIAVASTGNHSKILQFNNMKRSLEFFKDVPTEFSIRCCNFNPVKPHVAAFGLFNGSILIYDIESNKIEHVLKASDQRISVIQWHP